MEAGVGALLAVYLVYNLIVSKFFSPAIGPGAFRDLGILWDMADYVRANGRYEIGANYYPPPNAILLRLFGSIGQELAYRLFLLLRIAAFVAVLWAWCRLLGISRRQDRMLIVLAAVLPVAFYLHVEFHMHNVNLITLALVSVAMAIECRPLWSGAGYGLALALKPYGSVLILPWMVWRGRWCWVLSALGWLAVFFLVMPMVWFGPDAALPLNREWMVSLVTGAQTAHDQLLSLRGGIAFLLGASTADPLVGRLNWAATALYVLALVAFFLPTLLRREPASRVMLASEIAAMLLAPLPLGGLQQPARASALIAATLVMAAACFEAGRSRRARAALAAVLVAIGLACNAVPLGPLHFLLMMPVCLMALAGLAIARGTHARGAPAYDTVR